MKSVLISIRPKWCELIASGEKTIEVRKTCPKIETPFKCYIYCTQSGKYTDGKSVKNIWLNRGTDKRFIGNGKVIGEFVCDRIYPIQAVRYDNGSFEHSRKSIFTFLRPAEHNALLDATRLENEEIFDYLGGEGKEGYAWHISNLTIYDKPKELSKFISSKPKNKFRAHGDNLTRPPQSWCYVEELE